MAATTALEGALDFSKKTLEKPEDTKSSSESPVPSLNSEGESNRSASVSSDTHEHMTENSTIAAVKPMTATSQSAQERGSPPGAKGSSPTSRNSDSPTEGGSRPFKMYPYDSMAGLFSNPLAGAGAELYSAYAAAASSTVPYGAGLGGGLGPSLLDSAMLTSPFNAYFSRKRRMQSTTSTPTTSSSTTPPTTPLASKSTEENSGNNSDSCSSLTGHDGQVPNEHPDKKAKFEPEERRDEAYWERRRKNNEAAKRSRDARRMKEEEIAMRAAFLEQENLKLRAQVAILKNETAKLHYMLYNRS